MAPQSSVPLLRALPALLLAAAPRGCSGAPAGGRALQTVVGPDGTLTQVEPASPAAAAALAAEGRAGAAGGAGQPPAYGPTRPTAYAAPAYAGGSPAYASRGAPPGYSVPVSSAAPASSAPVYSAAASAGPPCLVPMWDEESYVCKEHEDFMSVRTEMPAPQWVCGVAGCAWSEARPSTPGAVADAFGVTRVWLPDASKCTVGGPGKYSFWMTSAVTEMMCTAGVWDDGKGKPITAIEMQTALWFTIASAVVAVAAVYLVYKMCYDTESPWYTWRQEQAVKWGFATAPPPVEEAGGDAKASGPQHGINISISNASGGGPAPAAQAK